MRHRPARGIFRGLTSDGDYIVTASWLRALLLLIGMASTLSAAAQASADQPSLQSGTVMDAAERLKPGEFLWAPEIAPKGPVLLVVSLTTQRAVAYRNGIPIAISTVSTGRPGYATPTGVFVILQKHVEHYSNIYDNAPMPYMQRLTWGGIALHAGDLPGYPASHGCIRLPPEFARLLFQVTHRGMTVVITDKPVVPRIAPAEELLGSKAGAARSTAGMDWQPERSPDGPMSVLVSAADQRLVVLRNGVVIGSSPVEIDGAIGRTTAYLLSGVVNGERNWTRVALPGQAGDAPDALRGRIQVPETFRRLVDPVLTIGTTVIVTADTLRSDRPDPPMTVLEADDSPADQPR